MINLQMLLCLVLMALARSVSSNILSEEDNYRETLQQLKKLTDNGGLEKMRMLLGSEEFDRLMSVFAGDGDPDQKRPILGGEDDPDHYKPILGGEDDPDQYRPILGGEDDPDQYRPILGGEDDPDQYRPILGGEDDPDHYKLRPILGGEDDPDHNRPILGGEDDPDRQNSSGSGQSDPEQDDRATAESERDEMDECPGKFGRIVPKSGNFKPIRGKIPAKQGSGKGSESDIELDIPVDVDPCVPSDLPDPRSMDELCEAAECPGFEVQEIEGACGFELRRYNAGVWVMTKMDTKRGITEAFAEASGKLMAYMNGENDGNVKMDTTLPKTVLNIIKKKGAQKTAYLCQFLPVSHHENPPEPLEGRHLVVKRNPEMQYYVRAFGGKPSIDRYRREFGMLAAAIKKSGFNAVWNMRFLQDYSNPRDEEQRHEVAVMVAPSKS